MELLHVSDDSGVGFLVLLNLALVQTVAILNFVKGTTYRRSYLRCHAELDSMKKYLYRIMQMKNEIISF